MSGIQDFYSAAQEKEFARDFQFRVVTLGPYEENDLLYITTATLPGKTIVNKPVPFMGLNFNIPGSVQYTGSEGWEVTFRCDEGLNIRNKAENWMKEIFDDATSTGKYGVPVEVGEMQLLGKNMQALRSYLFYGIYPTVLAPISYDKTGDGEPVTFGVTFAYQFWRLKV
jgi:hypothetical protein